MVYPSCNFVGNFNLFSNEINPILSKEHEPLVIILLCDSMKIYESFVISGNLILLL